MYHIALYFGICERGDDLEDLRATRNPMYYQIGREFDALESLVEGGQQFVAPSV
jgi:hypothetical protein